MRREGRWVCVVPGEEDESHHLVSEEQHGDGPEQQEARRGANIEESNHETVWSDPVSVVDEKVKGV